MILSAELTWRHQNQPLGADGYLNKNAEKEEKNLVNNRKVHPGVEGDEEHLLDHDRGVDEHV